MTAFINAVSPTVLRSRTFCSLCHSPRRPRAWATTSWLCGTSVRNSQTHLLLSSNVLHNLSPSSSSSSSSPSMPKRAKTTMIRGFPNNFKGAAGGTGGYDSGVMWEQLIDFPCVFTFKIIGMQQGDFANDIIDSVALALDMDRKYLKTSFRDRGKYRSITVDAPVNTVDQIRDVYAAIDRDPRVKFKF